MATLQRPQRLHLGVEFRVRGLVAAGLGQFAEAPVAQQQADPPVLLVLGADERPVDAHGRHVLPRYGVAPQQCPVAHSVRVGVHHGSRTRVRRATALLRRRNGRSGAGHPSYAQSATGRPVRCGALRRTSRPPAWWAARAGARVPEVRFDALPRAGTAVEMASEQLILSREVRLHIVQAQRAQSDDPVAQSTARPPYPDHAELLTRTRSPEPIHLCWPLSVQRVSDLTAMRHTLSPVRTIWESHDK